MRYLMLPWSVPLALETIDLSLIPASLGVYVFTEDEGPLRPNPAVPSESDPGYRSVMESLRSMPCVLYVGKSSSLRTRLPGYRFRPYLEIRRRDGLPRHVTSPHKGRALLHAQQFFTGAGTFI